MQEIKYSRNILQIIRKDIRNTFYMPNIQVLAHVDTMQSRLKSLQEKDSQTASEKKAEKLFQQFASKEIYPFLYENEKSATGGLSGEKDRLHLASFSNVPTTTEAKTSSQQLVTYYLKTCKNKLDNKIQSTCLWRKTSPAIEQDMEDFKNYKEFVLLENVEKFELLYYNLSTNEWLPEWKTAPNEKNTLPSAINIKFNFKEKKQLTHRETTLQFYQQLILPVQEGDSYP